MDSHDWHTPFEMYDSKNGTTASYTPGLGLGTSSCPHNPLELVFRQDNPGVLDDVADEDDLPNQTSDNASYLSSITHGNPNFSEDDVIQMRTIRIYDVPRPHRNLAMALLDRGSQANLIKLEKVRDMGLMALMNHDEEWELKFLDGRKRSTVGLLELRWSEKNGKEVWTSSFGVMEQLEEDVVIGGVDIERNGLSTKPKKVKQVNTIYCMKTKKQKKDLEKQFLPKPRNETTSVKNSERESLKMLGKPNANPQSSPRSISQWTSQWTPTNAISTMTSQWTSKNARDTRA